MTEESTEIKENFTMIREETGATFSEKDFVRAMRIYDEKELWQGWHSFLGVLGKAHNQDVSNFEKPIINDYKLVCYVLPPCNVV